MKAVHNEHMFVDAINNGYLEIDRDGKIWRIATNCKTNKYPIIPKREIKTQVAAGYIRICLYGGRKIYGCFAHRIVWVYYNGEIPDGLEINHKNGVKTDNRLENLEIVTKSENEKHAYKIGLKCNKGEKHSQVKLTENDVKKIRLRATNYETQASIAKDFSISSAQVSDIVNRKQWKHI